MSSYTEVENEIFIRLAQAYVEGRSSFVGFDFSTNDPDNATQKLILAKLKAEGSIEQDAGSTVARFTDAGYNKYRDRIAALQTLT